MAKRTKTGDDYDSPWKVALHKYLKWFLAFFFPSIHDDIDWPRGYETLDKEFQQIVRRARVGKQIGDMLFKVWLKDGSECWLLIHVEIQGAYEKDFPRRMFNYNTAIHALYNREVVSLAVLCDERVDWRPTWKFRLVRGLYERKLTKTEIVELFRIIDWILDLPEDLQERFREDIQRYEQEKHMPYLSSLERSALEKGRTRGRAEGRMEGLLEGIALALQAKFGKPGRKLLPKTRQVKDVARLRRLKQLILAAKTLDDVRRQLPELIRPADE